MWGPLSSGPQLWALFLRFMLFYDGGVALTCAIYLELGLFHLTQYTEPLEWRQWRRGEAEPCLVLGEHRSMARTRWSVYGLSFREPNDFTYTLTSKERNPTDLKNLIGSFSWNKRSPAPRIMKLCGYINDSSLISGWLLSIQSLISTSAVQRI